jgi:hypothetical protein
VRDCIQKVISELRSLRSPNIRETLLESTLLIEKFTGTGDWRGISSNVDDAEVPSDLIAELRQTLINFARTHPEHPDVGTAIWALSKFFDESLRGFFIAEMRRHLDAGRVHPVWQADCALGNLGDSVEYDYSPGEASHDSYFDAVRRYLQKNAQ